MFGDVTVSCWANVNKRIQKAMSVLQHSINNKRKVIFSQNLFSIFSAKNVGKYVVVQGFHSRRRIPKFCHQDACDGPPRGP